MFPYKIATIDSGFAFVNNIECLNLNFIAGCFLVGVGFLGYGGGVSGPWGPGGVVPKSLNHLSQTAEPKGHIHSAAREARLRASDMMFL